LVHSFSVLIASDIYPVFDFDRLDINNDFNCPMQSPLFKGEGQKSIEKLTATINPYQFP
jgi:hypothetical protein